MIRSRFLLILFTVSVFLLFHSSLLMSIKKQLPFNFLFYLSSFIYYKCVACFISTFITDTPL